MWQHLVTSGCSFSDNLRPPNGDLTRWPMFLADYTGMKLYNRGQGSAGNDWIADSTIYQLSELLNQGCKPQEIIAIVMWSGIDRNSIFISSDGTPKYADLHVEQFMSNPASFTANPANEYYNPPREGSGWLLGSAHCSFPNDNIQQYKQLLVARYLNDEALMIRSLDNWLKLQWFCAARGVKLVNLTYMNIWHYPGYGYISDKDQTLESIPYFYDHYGSNIQHLYRELDQSQWLFYGDRGGMYEWCKSEGLGFYSDLVHPSIDSHRKFAEEWLWPRIS